MDEETNLLTDTKPEAFLDGISEEHHSAVSGFGNKGELAKGYASLYQKMGTSVQIPDENTPSDEISAFWNKLGRPDTPDGYVLPSLPEGQEYDKEFVGSAKIAAHEIGTSQPQFAKWVEWYLGMQNKKTEVIEAEKIRASEEGDRALKEKWGADYEVEATLVQRACDELVDDKELHDEFAQLIEDKGLKNNRVFALVFNGIGKKMLDDTFVKGGGQVEDKDYKPANPNSPEMYATGEDEDSRKARAYFRRTMNHDYGKDD